MNDVFGKLTDILVFCVVGFILPAFLTAFLMEEVKGTTANITVREFAEDVAAKGYLDKERYEAFLLELNAAGMLTETELKAEHDLLAPEYKMRSIEDMEEYLESLWSGSNVLNQPPMSTQRPAVTDPGSRIPSGISGNVTGTDTSTSGPSPEHDHNDSCYGGLGHTHTDECYAGEMHVHTGNSSSGTGCYTGAYVSGGNITCGTLVSTGTANSNGAGYMFCDSCSENVWSPTYHINGICDGCGETFVHETYYVCANCSRVSFRYTVYYHEKTGSGQYELGCGKTEGVYYNADGSLAAPICGMQEISGTVTKHTHTDACETTEVNCTAGCSLHTHTGSSSSGTGCYTGAYVSGSEEYCGEFSITDGVWEGPYSSSSSTCPDCGKTGTLLIWTKAYWCDASGGLRDICSMNISENLIACSECGYEREQSRWTTSHYISSGGYYELDCGKSLTTYYNASGNVCDACSGTGKVSQINCTLEAGKYYDANGNEAIPSCNKIVASLTPLYLEQIVNAGVSPDVRVKATFADGHSEVVTASMTGFNAGSYNTVQTVTLSYGEYAGSLDNVQAATCTAKRLVRYPTKTCANGHLYYLASGNSTPCPYCAAYPKTLTVQGVEETPFRIRKGSTLRDNGVFLKVTYYDGRTEIVRSGFTDTLDKNYVGEQNVTIGYGGATTTLLVYTGRIKVNCSVCGYEYQLYPDDTDPGCPKCLAAVPEFTGNVLRYKESVSYGEILDELYYGDGICYFSRGDRFEIELWKNPDNMSGVALGRILHAEMPKELVAMYGVKIRDEETEK